MSITIPSKKAGVDAMFINTKEKLIKAITIITLTINVNTLNVGVSNRFFIIYDLRYKINKPLLKNKIYF